MLSIPLGLPMIAFAGNPLEPRERKAPRRAMDRGQVARCVLADPAGVAAAALHGRAARHGVWKRASCARALCEGLAAPDAPCIFLGLEGERAMFALDISAADDPQHTDRWPDWAISASCARAAPLLPVKDRGDPRPSQGDDRLAPAARLLRAAAVRRRVAADAGYKRVCTACDTEHFPRTDPVVIMLATQGDACLVGTQQELGRRFLFGAGGISWNPAKASRKRCAANCSKRSACAPAR